MPAPKPRDPQYGSGWPFDAIALLALLFALLFLFQYTTLEKFSALPPAKNYVTLENFLAALQKHGVSLNLWDGISAAAILLICIGLVALEAWKRRLSLFFERIFESEKRTLFFLGLSSFVLVRFYFARGESSWAADTSLHTVYAWIASQAFSQWEIPIWTNIFSAGSPYLQFYGFLFFYLVGLVNLAFGDPFFSIKCVMAAGHVASGIGMYLFVRSTGRSRPAGFLAGMAFVLSFYHTQQVLIMGRLPLSVFYALLPWPFYFFERLRLRRRGLPSAIGGAVTLGCLAFTHPGYGFWATAFLGLYMALRYGRGRADGAPVGYALLLFFGGVVFGSYLTLPMWLERGYTGLHAGFSMSHFPDPTWQQLVLWSNHRIVLFPQSGGHTHWYGGYLGISLIALAIAGLIGLLQKRRMEGVAGALCLAGALILVFGYRWPLLRSLGIVQALNAGRYLLFVVFFLSLMAGFGTDAIIGNRRRRPPSIGAFVLLLMAVTADLGCTTFQHPYLSRRADGPGIIDMPEDTYRKLKEEAGRYPEGAFPGYRFFYTTDHTYRATAVSWLSVKIGIPSFFHLYNEHPPAVSAFMVPLEELAKPLLIGVENPAELAVAPGYDIISQGFYLLNTRHILVFQPEKGRSLKWRLPRVSPILVSARAAGWDYPIQELDALRAREEFQKLLKAMGGVDESAASCGQILLADFEGQEDLGTSPRAEVLAHRVWNQRVEMRVRISEPCYARLAYAYYPYLRVIVDGRETAPLQTAGRFVALRLEPGEHRIVLEPTLSPLRRGLLALDLCLLVAAAVLLLRRRLRG